MRMRSRSRRSIRALPGESKMRIAFSANEGGYVADESAHVCGVSNGKQWLTFQRGPKGSNDHWGVYLEYCDQINGGYNCVSACRFRPETLTVDLGKQLGRLV